VKAHAIVTQYSTALNLYNAFTDSDDKSLSLLEQLQTNDKKKLGKKVAKTVGEFYTSESY
jgi:hypothetical protein